MFRNIKEKLFDYIESQRGLFWITNADASTVLNLIKTEIDTNNPFGSECELYSYNKVEYIRESRNRVSESKSLYDFFCIVHEKAKNCVLNNRDSFFICVLEDVNDEVNKDRRVIALIKIMMSWMRRKDEYNVALINVASKAEIPLELEQYATVLDLPLPNYEEIGRFIIEFAEKLELTLEQNLLNELSRSLKGLNFYQIEQILSLAYHNCGLLDEEALALVLNEKEQIIRKSGILELIRSKDKIDDIGGLENLKEWLEQKAQIYKNFDRAIRFGVSVPKGVLIFGMPGCGKSMCAKATADLFKLPLVRLDVGRILGKYVGESEHNMRRALDLAEAISPCVLWVDEIEKAFAGFNHGDDGSEVTVRLFGQFLTWMQEKENSVFIVATANDIKMLPPEFLRKGRFDDLFFVDLPNKIERREILKIHLKKRGKLVKNLNLSEIIEETEGYCGADLETLVNDAVEKLFIRNQEGKEHRDNVTEGDLLQSKKAVHSITDTMADKIQELKKLSDVYKIQSASRNPGKQVEIQERMNVMMRRKMV